MQLIEFPAMQAIAEKSARATVTAVSALALIASLDSAVLQQHHDTVSSVTSDVE
jgi:hypothetical protein